MRRLRPRCGVQFRPPRLPAREAGPWRAPRAGHLVPRSRPFRLWSQAGRDSFRTKTKKATLEASWDEQFYFGKKGRKGAILSEDTLRVEVWDDDTIFDESVGVVSVPLAGESAPSVASARAGSAILVDKSKLVRCAAPPPPASADIRNPAAPTKTVALPIIGPKGKERGQLFMS